MLLAKIVTDQASFNLCQERLPCFVLYIQHKQISEQEGEKALFCHLYGYFIWCFKVILHYVVHFLCFEIQSLIVGKMALYQLQVVSGKSVWKNSV